MTSSETKKAAEARAKSEQSKDAAPAERKSPEAAQQESAADEGVLARIDDAVKRAEDAADRAVKAAEQAASVAGLEIPAEKPADEPKEKGPEIGSPEWQKANQVAALEEELGFAKNKGQDDRVKAIEAEIKRVKKG